MEPMLPTQHIDGLVKGLLVWPQYFCLGNHSCWRMSWLSSSDLLMSGGAQCIWCVPDTLLCQMLFFPPHLGVDSTEKEVIISTGYLSAWLMVPWVSRHLVTYGAGFGKINHKLIWKVKQVLCDCGIAQCNNLVPRLWLLRCIASTRTYTHINAACRAHPCVQSAHLGCLLWLWVNYSSNCNLYKA